jgi:hypothetical protein
MLERAGESERIRKAREAILDELIGGEIAIAGVLRGDHEFALCLIAPQFAVGAEITSLHNLKRGDTVFERLKVLDQSHFQLLPEAEPKNTPPAPTYFTASDPLEKVPPPNKLRSWAIEQAFEADAVVFDGSTNIESRTAIYKQRIEARYPHCDLGQRGFDVGSFEASETIFKKKHGFTTP